jgi:hypothetical protein
MRREVAFIAGYAAVLVLAALALHRLGRAAGAPVWQSRLLAGYRRDTAPGRPAGTGSGPEDRPGVDWPHVEARRLHSGVAVVAASAALLLAGAEGIRHHRPAETALLTAVACAALAVLAWLARGLRQRRGADVMHGPAGRPGPGVSA